MDRATRNKMVSGTGQADLTTGNACWETPPLIFDKLNEDFGPFDIDLTADSQRHLCDVWFGPDSPYGSCGYDALNVNMLDDPQCIGDWSASLNHCGYSNPPYGPFIQKILPLAKANALHCGFTSVFLLPLRVTKAFKAHILIGAADLVFPDKRIVFFENGAPRINQKLWLTKGKLSADPAIFDSIIVRYAPGTPVDASPKLSTWEVPIHVTAQDLERARRLQPTASSDCRFGAGIQSNSEGPLP